MELRQVNVLCAERWGDIDGLRCGNRLGGFRRVHWGDRRAMRTLSW